MAIRWVLLLILMCPSLSLAAPAMSERDWQILKNIARNGGAAGITMGTELPLTCTPGTGPNAFFLDTDTDTLSYCSDTDTFLAISTGQTVTLDNAFDNGSEINGATSATPAIIGNGTQKGKLYGDATKGFMIEPDPLGDSAWRCWTNFNCVIRDEEAAATMFTIDPDAASTRLMYEFGANYRPRGYFYVPASAFVGDGTNCPSSASAVTINSGPKVYTMICGSSSNGDMDFDVVMPMDWDGGTVIFEVSYTQTAANTSAMNSDIKAQCRAAGETPSSTWGTAIAIDDAAVTGSNAEDKTASAAVTPAGTCAAGDHLFVRYTLDVTGTTTTEASLNFYGVGVYYSKRYWGN